MTDAVPVPKKRGCLFYGCLTLIAALLAVVIIGLLGYRYLVLFFNQFTDPTPVTIESVEVPASELQALRDRVTPFARSLQDGKPGRQLDLTARDINALIANDPAFRELRGRLEAQIEGDQLKARVSLPLGNMGPFRLKGRYFNGTVQLAITMEKGRPRLTIVNAESKGKPLPGLLLNQLRQLDFGEILRKNTAAGPQMEHLKNVQVQNNQLILRSNDAP